MKRRPEDNDNKAAREHQQIMDAIMRGLQDAKLMRPVTPKQPVPEAPTVDDALKVKIALANAGFRIGKAPDLPSKSQSALGTL